MKVHIKVWLTKKTKQIRAQITEECETGNCSYEVTVGGEEWNKGKGKQYKQQILRKIDGLSIRINSLKQAIENE